MAETEFWASTLAKVTELYRLQIQDWAYTRDHFVAEVSSLLLNRRRQSQRDKVWTAEDFLQAKYPPRKQPDVMNTHDPDHGALGDWRSLRGSMKSYTQSAKMRAGKRRYSDGQPVK